MNITGYRYVVIHAVPCACCSSSKGEPCADMSMTYSQAGQAGWPEPKHVDYVHDERSLAYHNTLGVALPDE